MSKLSRGSNRRALTTLSNAHACLVSFLYHCHTPPLHLIVSILSTYWFSKSNSSITTPLKFPIYLENLFPLFPLLWHLTCPCASLYFTDGELRFCVHVLHLVVLQVVPTLGVSPKFPWSKWLSRDVLGEVRTKEREDVPYPCWVRMKKEPPHPWVNPDRHGPLFRNFKNYPLYHLCNCRDNLSFKSWKNLSNY